MANPECHSGSVGVGLAVIVGVKLGSPLSFTLIELSVQSVQTPRWTACHPCTFRGRVSTGAEQFASASSMVPDRPSASYGTVCQQFCLGVDDSAAAGSQPVRSAR